MFTTFNKFQPKLTSVSKCCQMLTIGLFLDQKDFGPIFFLSKTTRTITTTTTLMGFDTIEINLVS